jgi:hypothetical protein
MEIRRRAEGTLTEDLIRGQFLPREVPSTQDRIASSG